MSVRANRLLPRNDTRSDNQSYRSHQDNGEWQEVCTIGIEEHVDQEHTVKHVTPWQQMETTTANITNVTATLLDILTTTTNTGNRWYAGFGTLMVLKKIIVQITIILEKTVLTI